MKFICEPSTWEEFWSKNTGVLQTLMDESVEGKVAFDQLSNFIKELYSNENHIEEGSNILHKVVFLCDDSAYDFSHLNVALEKYCDELPLGFSNWMKLKTMLNFASLGDTLPSDGYRDIRDPSERIVYHPNKATIKLLTQKFSQHTHMPDDDAEGIYLQYLLMKDENFFDEMKSKVDLEK